MFVDVLRDLREAPNRAQAGSVSLALNALRKVLRELDRRLHPKPGSTTDALYGPEGECTTHVFMLCQSAATALSARYGIPNATQTLDQAIQAYLEVEQHRNARSEHA